MKIGSHIKPRNGKSRIVTVLDQEYEFLPIKDKEERTHFVAEVKNPDHAEIFVKSDHFYAYGKDMAPAVPKPALQNPAADAGAEKETPPADPIHAEAVALIALPVSKMAIETGKVSSPAVLRKAIELETASETGRDSALKTLRAALDGAIAAGVKG